jgi:hypothetical protein
MTRRPVLKIAVLTAVILLASMPMPTDATQQASVATQNSSAKIGQLLTASGYTFKQANDTVWSIDFTGKSLEKFKVILATNEDLVVIFAIVAQKRNIPLTTDLMSRMLRFDHDLDCVKVGLDNDGDAFVRTDLRVRVVDGQELKAAVDQIAASANEVYAGVKPYLTN